MGSREVAKTLSGDTVGGLPEGWGDITLADICDINPRKPAVGELAPDAEVTFAPMPAVDAEARAITNAAIRTFEQVRKGFTSFRDEDVILAKITPCFENGKAAICRGLLNGLGFGSTEFHVLRSNGAVLPEYVYRFVQQDSFLRDGQSNMTGSVGQKRVPAAWLASVRIPLPPLQSSGGLWRGWRRCWGGSRRPARGWPKSPPSSNASANPSSPPPAREN